MSDGVKERLEVPLLILFGTIVSLIAWQCYERPFYNADILPYMAVVLNYEEKDLTKVHRETYALAKEQIPSAHYKRLTDSSHRQRAVILHDVDQFFKNVSFFRIKPLYSGLIYLSNKIGIPLVKATILPSIFSFVFISVLLSIWLRKTFSTLTSTLICLAVLISPPVIEGARLSTPDSLSAGFILLAFFFMAHNYKWHWIALVLTLSILARLDNIILSTMLLAFCFFYQQGKANYFSFRGTNNAFAFFLFVIGWVVYGSLVLWFASFQNVFGNLLNQKMNIGVLLLNAVNGLGTIQSSLVPTVILIYGAVTFYKPPTMKSLSYGHWFFLLLLTYVTIKYTVFPDLSTRHYLPVYIVAILKTMQGLLIKESERSIEPQS